LIALFLPGKVIAQVVIKEKVEVDASRVSSLTAAEFTAAQDGSLEIDLTQAYRLGSDSFPPDEVFLNVYINGSAPSKHSLTRPQVLNDKIFERNWTVQFNENGGLCFPAGEIEPLIVDSYDYFIDETIVVGDVLTGDVITAHLVVVSDTLGDDPGEYVITQNGDEWNILIQGYSIYCQDTGEELVLDARIVNEYFIVTATPDTVSVADTSAITVVVTDPGEAGVFDVDIALSDTTQGYFELVRELEVGLFEVEQAGPALELVPYSALDPAFGASDRFVRFIAEEAPLPPVAKRNSTSILAPDEIVQITATRSDDASATGSGDIVILENPIKFVKETDPGVYEELTHLVISNWDNAYDGMFNVRNSFMLEENFIDLDSDKFFIQVTDKSQDQNTGVDLITVGIRTEGRMGGDNLTDIELRETGNNTGVFRSASQLLTAPLFDNIPSVGTNIHRYSDDGFEVYDNGVGATVVDDSINDRTHWTDVGGSVTIEYTDLNAKLITAEVPVCEDYKEVKYQIVNFMEPFEDVGLDGVPNTGDEGEGNGVFDCSGQSPCTNHAPGTLSEPYYNVSKVYLEKYQAYTLDLPISSASSEFIYPIEKGEQQSTSDPSHYGRGKMAPDENLILWLDRANKIWAPACIRFEQADDPILSENPTGFLRKDIFENLTLEAGNFPDEQNDLVQIFEHFNSNYVMDEKVVYIFLGPEIFYVGDQNLIDPYGIAVTTYTDHGYNQSLNEGKYSFIYLAPGYPPVLLAHEFVHILTELGHSSDPVAEMNVPYLAYPTNITPGDYDYSVNTWRRLTERVISLAKQNQDLLHNP